MTERLPEALEIVGVGIGGVFLNLLILMLAIQLIGAIFGKKPQKPARPGSGAGPAAGASQSQ